MITYKVGRMMGTQAVQIPKEVLTESVIGQIYELQIKTQGVTDPRAAAVALSKGLRERFGAELLYFEVDGDIITIQIEGSPFAWAALLVFLPEILVVVGVVILFILVYLITSAIPSWKYGLIAVALVLIFIGPGAVSKVAMMKVRK